jgi:GntR family transcriptional regulator
MNSILPIYYQIKQAIKTWIIDREFNPGEKIPSEHELAEKFGVSRLTVRQATAQLTQEGFLTSRRGEGTFVTDDVRLIESCNFEFHGLIDDFFFAQLADIETKSAKIERTVAPKPIREKLGLGKAEGECVRIERVRSFRGRLLTFSTNYLPVEIGGRIDEKALYEKPLLRILEQDLGIRFVEAVQTIAASFADARTARHLAVQSGSPILFVERVVYGNDGKAIEVFQSSYPGDLYRFIVRYKSVMEKNGSTWVHRGN